MGRSALREVRYHAPAKVIGVQPDLFGGRDVEMLAEMKSVPSTWGRDLTKYGRAICGGSGVVESAPLYLLGCVKTKGAAPCAAQDLYTSDWFKKARAYVEALGVEWRILSAEYGVVPPNAHVEPYERTLRLMSQSERGAWGDLVVGQLGAVAGINGRPIVLLAGAHYRKPVEAWAGARAFAPMAGLGLGAQKAWLLAQKEAASRRVDDKRK